MKILQTLYFYTPYTSGLTIYCERLSRELVRRGHEVTVLTSWHDRSLPRENVTADGVRVVRVPIAANLSRAVIMPKLLPTAAKLIREHDVVHMHLPMAEAGGIARAAKDDAVRQSQFSRQISELEQFFGVALTEPGLRAHGSRQRGLGGQQ